MAKASGDAEITHLRVNQVLDDFKLCLVFMTRIPLRLKDRERSLAQAAALMPLVGVIVGLVGAALFFVAHGIGLPPLAAAAVAVFTSIALTGALHEDGLADVADGFGGGLVRARKLEIMRDSRIGSYGVIAIGLSLILRIVLIAEIAARADGPWEIAAALIAVHTLGRGFLPAVMAGLPLARGDGLAARADRPRGKTAGLAFIASLVIALLCLGPAAGLTAVIAAAIAIAFMAWLARRQIGGYTGDVLGAAEQLGEIAALAAITALL